MNDERRKENIDLLVEVKNLNYRFDSELGTGKGDGSVKKHMRYMGDKIDKIHEIILGSSLDNPGILTKLREVNHVRRELRSHIQQDHWMFGVLIVLEGWALVKLYLL